MPISKNMLKQLQEQVQREWEAQFYYLEMMAWCLNNNYDGFGAWFLNHSREEHKHGMKILTYLNDIDEQISIPSVQVGQTKFRDVEHLFEVALKHEQKVTKSIHDLVGQAIKESDYRTHQFLQWYVLEQIEEEHVVTQALAKVKRAKGAPAALLMIESQLSSGLPVEAEEDAT